MKKLYSLCYLAMVLSIVGTAVLLAFTPDIIPVHYNFAGEVDRFGSKYENLLWPFCSIAVGGFLLVIARAMGKKGNTKDEKVILYTSLFTMLFFEILGCFFMVKAIQYDAAEAARFSMDIIKFVGISLGGLQVILGFLMSRTGRNSFFGLRTKWSMASDKVWQKSQRFAGISSITCGAIMIAMVIFVPDIWNLLALAIIVTIWATASIMASYYYYKVDRKAE